MCTEIKIAKTKCDEKKWHFVKVNEEKIQNTAASFFKIYVQ